MAKKTEKVIEDTNKSHFEEVMEEKVEQEESGPIRGSVEWTDYILGLLTEDEVVNECPKTDGLWRVACSLNKGISYGVNVLQTSPDYAAVTVSINARQGLFDYCVISGSAECSALNTDPPYNKYPLATAETRALGRALKRLLCINVLTAEESSRAANLTIPVSDENRTEGSITSTQISFIERMCKKIDINLENAIIYAVGLHENINELSHAEALRINETLDAWSRDKSEDPEYKKLGKFDTSWKSSFYKEGK